MVRRGHRIRLQRTSARCDMRWLNIGPAGHGPTRTIAGGRTVRRAVPGLRGLREARHRRRPQPAPRAPALVPRTGRRPTSTTSTVALSRTLRTQGLLIRLPHTVTLGDDFAVPSLAAALLLGLREQIGGHPDHIRVEQVVEPTLSRRQATTTTRCCCTTPFPAAPATWPTSPIRTTCRTLLVLAWDRVRDCECRYEERLACHRCLLPFAPPGGGPPGFAGLGRTAPAHPARARSGRAHGRDTTWTVTRGWPPDEDPESHLEQRFRKVLWRPAGGARRGGHRESPGVGQRRCGSPCRARPGTGR